MECLAAGRGISLPSSNTGMAKLAVRAVGGYARVRTQFKTPIGKFEGVEEALTRMGGNLYMMDATRTLTAARSTSARSPRCSRRIAKYHVTERARAGRSTTAWTSSAARASAWGRRTSSARAYMQHAGRDHGRGRQHPDAQPDHLRPGRDPLPSVRAEGDRRDARGGPRRGVDRLRRGAVRPHPLHAVEPRAHARHGPHRLAFRRACRPTSRRRRGATTSS